MNIATLVIGFSLLLVQLPIAWTLELLTPGQMRKQFPGKSIIPLLWHEGYLYNYPMTLWLAKLVAEHGKHWTVASWSTASAIGAVVAVGMFQFAYTTGKSKEAHMLASDDPNGRGKVTLPGWVYAAYFAYALAIFLQCYVPWTNQHWNAADMWTTTGIVIGLLIVGQHFPLQLCSKLGWASEYSEKPFKRPDVWGAVLGVGLPLIGISYWRGGR